MEKKYIDLELFFNNDLLYDLSKINIQTIANLYINL